MKRINIDDKLYETIELFCKENELDMKEYINSLLLRAFTIEKFGEAPPFFKKSTEDTTTLITPTLTPVTELIPVQTMEEPEGLKEFKKEKEENKKEVKPAESKRKAEAKRRIQNL